MSASLWVIEISDDDKTKGAWAPHQVFFKRSVALTQMHENRQQIKSVKAAQDERGGPQGQEAPVIEWRMRVREYRRVKGQSGLEG